jgi:hypothetical protein
MATFKFNERSALENALGMGSGYVLNFSDRTFRDFIWDHVGRDVSDGAYSKYGTSKAKHLRAFWEVESDNVVAALTRALLQHGKDHGIIDDKQFEEANAVVARLGGGGVADIDALKPNAEEPTFDRLARAVRESIDAGRPEEGLDRLHTFMVKYVRTLAGKRRIDTPRDKPLHSVFGEYIKRLQVDGVLTSDMTLRIMRSAIGSLEAFNAVRNEQSLAHDNEVLRTHEALYIFNHVASLVRFLQAVEGTIPDVSLDDLSAPAS